MIGTVIFFNVQSAVFLLIQPEIYTTNMGLTGVAGIVYLRGIGILFIMWNVPYLFALWNPVRNRVSLYEAVCMQTIGLIGETILLLSLPDGQNGIEMILTRFIIFDGVGLLSLLGSVWITWAIHTPEAVEPGVEVN